MLSASSIAIALTLVAILLLVLFRKKPEQKKGQHAKKEHPKGDSIRNSEPAKVKKEPSAADLEQAHKAEALTSLTRLIGHLRSRRQQADVEKAASAQKLTVLKKYEPGYRHHYNLVVLYETELACLDRELSRAIAAEKDWPATPALTAAHLELLHQIRSSIKEFERLKLHEERRYADDRHAAAPAANRLSEPGLKLQAGLNKIVSRYELPRTMPDQLLGLGLGRD